MGGLILKGIGMGATFTVCALIPFPLLVLGLCAFFAYRRQETSQPEPQPEALTQQEQDELLSFMELIERAPDPRSAQALIEEFYI